MLKTKSSVTTDAGILLQLANLQGEAIEFTKIAVGCGQYTLEEQSAESLRVRSSLKEPRQTFGISSQELSANGTAIVLSCMVTNKELQEGYTIREIGLYARKKDQPDTEQLVSISLAEIEDELPAYDGASESRILMKYQFTVSDSDTVYLSYDQDPVALVKDVDAKLAEFSALIADSGSGGIAPSNMLRFTATAGDGEVKLFIGEPDDTVIDNQTLCTIAGVKIMRKDTDYPNTEKAGTEVLDIRREDFGKYATTPYKDTGLTNGTTYYYAAFPYSDYDVFNRNPANRASAEPKQYQLYGFDIDQNDSNPNTRVSYPSDVDNAEWSPMTVDQSTGAYDLGQWENAFFIAATRPVMLKYDGTVDYELDHDDQTKKKSGDASDVANTSYDGNAMVEFPKMYFKRWEDADGIQHVRVSDQQIDDDYKCYAHMYDGNELDYIYLPMFEGSSVSSKVRSIAGQTPMNSQTGATEKTQIEANGAGWQFDDWMDRQMVTHLLFLIGKSTDLQATFGNGHYTGGSTASSLLATGTLKSKGMFYGTSGNAAVKFFWLENYYGDRWDRTYGVVYTTGGEILTKPYPPYNTDGTGYTNTEITIAGTSGGCIKKTKMTELGEFPVDVSGSETTYQPDGCWFGTSQLNFLFWGAGCCNGRYVGAAFSVSYPFSDSHWAFGPALAYKQPIAA